VFLFLWQFFIPLVIFVFAYWKILAVVRRKIKAVPSQRNMARSKEPMAGTSRVVQANAKSSIEDKSQRDKKTPVATGSEGHREVKSQNKSKNSELSKAQVNVVKTMVYVTVCFTLCWMPMYLYHLLSTFQVIFGRSFKVFCVITGLRSQVIL